MRVLEPHQLQSNKKPKKHRAVVSPKTSSLILIIIVGITVYLSYGQRFGYGLSGDEPQKLTNVDPLKHPTENIKTELKQFTPDEFKKLYNSASYPNTEQLAELPEITGNVAADNRIRSLAETRGYKTSAVPVSSIVRLSEPYLAMDDLIQPHALLAWQELENVAKANAIGLQISSAYRSIEFQRDLFLDRLFARGVSTQQIANAQADFEIDVVLGRVAPPGYSRHHTGYAIDFACDGVGLESFVSTSCFTWLSADNYKNAKLYGFVPSYPDGASLQGPEPETWEYIWVGKDALLE